MEILLALQTKICTMLNKKKKKIHRLYLYDERQVLYITFPGFLVETQIYWLLKKLTT